MPSKKIAGSPLARVLNRSLTWKESVGMAAPESVAFDKLYQDALKAFEAIPDFPDAWEALQQRYTALSTRMRTIESTHVEADKQQRDAHSKTIQDALDEAGKLAADVAEKHRQLHDGAVKALVATCAELRGRLDRLAKGSPDVEADLQYAEQLGAGLKPLREHVSALKLIGDSHKAIDEYMGQRNMLPPQPVGELVAAADEALKTFDAKLGAAAASWNALRRQAAKLTRPPPKKDYAKTYGHDAARLDQARTGFEADIEALDRSEEALLKGIRDAKAFFAGPEFAKLNLWIHHIVKFNRRRRLEEADKRSAKSGAKKPAPVEADEDDAAGPPPLPARPTDDTAGRRIVILNPGLGASSVLTPAEEGKHDAFLRLDGALVPHRVRDLMNEQFGNFEFVNHHTVRLSKRRRLEFDMSLATAGEVRITLVNIGDPTYEH